MSTRVPFAAVAAAVGLAGLLVGAGLGALVPRRGAAQPNDAGDLDAAPEAGPVAPPVTSASSVPDEVAPPPRSTAHLIVESTGKGPCSVSIPKRPRAMTPYAVDVPPGKLAVACSFGRVTVRTLVTVSAGEDVRLSCSPSTCIADHAPQK